MRIIACESARLLAWALFVLGVGSLLTGVADQLLSGPPALRVQYWVWGCCSACWYGWWRLLKLTDEV